MQVRTGGNGRLAVIPDTFGLDGRYRWVRNIASRGQGYAELCQDTWSGGHVVIKGMWWTPQELFSPDAGAVYKSRVAAIADDVRIHVQLANLTQAVPAILDLLVGPSPTRIEHNALNPHNPAWNNEGLIVMQFIGEPDLSTMSLETLVQRHGPLDAAAAVQMADQVAAALEAMHTPRRLTTSEGVPQDGLYYWAHSDLKPDNILVSGNPHRFTLIDLGVAQPIPANERNAPEVIGATAGYCPPDLAEPLTARFDLYSLAATVLFALTGQAPPADPDPRAIGDALTQAHVHPTLLRLVTTGMQPDRTYRVRSANVLRRELAAVRTALATSQVLAR